MRSNSLNLTRSKQRGATLVMALIVLVLIMMLGITAVNTSNTQFKITANLQLEDTAFNNAEIAVNAAQTWLRTGKNYQNSDFFTTQVAAGILQPTESNSPITMAWTDSDSVAVNATARYTIQLLSINSVTAGSSAVVGRGTGPTGCNSKVNTYLITGYGTSARGAKKFVQSYYGVPVC
jgi:type IV pilus assembly protein PilX